jgi:hypothetical protein
MLKESNPTVDADLEAVMQAFLSQPRYERVPKYERVLLDTVRVDTYELLVQNTDLTLNKVIASIISELPDDLPSTMLLKATQGVIEEWEAFTVEKLPLEPALAA